MDMTALSTGNVANRNAVATKAQKESNRKLAIRATVGIVLLSLAAWFYTFSPGTACFTLLAVLSLAGASKAPVPGLILTAVFGIIALSYYGGAVEAHRFAALTPAQQAAEVAANEKAAAAKAEAEKVAAKEQARREAEARMAHNQAIDEFGQRVATSWLIGTKKLPGLDPKAEIGTFTEGHDRGLGPVACGTVTYERRRLYAIVERDVLYMEAHAVGFPNLYRELCQ